MDSTEQSPATTGSQAQFPTTRWTQIVEAGGPTSTGAREALNELCGAYWSPVYAYLRRKGIDSHQAKDLTQSFFVRLLEMEFHKLANRNKGRFRSFLLTALNNFRIEEWRRQNARKRGGAAHIVSIDENEAEERFDRLPQQEPDPIKIFDRAWADTVIGHTKTRLKDSFARRGRLEVFDALAPFLAREPDPTKYAELAGHLNMTRENVQVTLSRMNDAFGECLRAEIARTVETPADTDDELRYLLAAWSAKVESEELEPG
jgi:RNA polymerase sigma-70 factor (ECF subfamily)